MFYIILSNQNNKYKEVRFYVLSLNAILFKNKVNNIY